MKEIGKTLKKLRKQQGYTQRQIAKYLNISQSLYAKYETQTRNPPSNNNQKTIRIIQLQRRIHTLPRRNTNNPTDVPQ